MERPLDASTVEGWLLAWSRLEELVTEAAALAMIAYTIDTSDAEKEKDHLRFSTEILPKMEERSVELARRFVALGYSTPELATTLARFRTSIEIFREANVPLFSELEELSARYQRITGSMTVEWDGVERPLPQLQPFLKSPDRAVRERAFRGCHAAVHRGARRPGGAVRPDVRAAAAGGAQRGLRQLPRLHLPGQVPLRLHPGRCASAFTRPSRRRSRRPWRGCSSIGAGGSASTCSGRGTWRSIPYRATPLRPFETVEQFVGTARRVFDRVDPVLGGQFQTMIDERLLDLDSRKGKAPGGYCETLHFRGRPFIFMNAVGLVDDVMTLLHEAGHAFHAFASHRQPLIWQRHPGLGSGRAGIHVHGAARVAASGAAHRLLHARGPPRARGSSTWRTCCSAWSTSRRWTRSRPGSTPPDGGDAAARDEAWLRIRSRFERGVDWSGLETERVARWYRQLHIFMYPFYYIEYGIAQLGALQIWRNSLDGSRRGRGAAIVRRSRSARSGASPRCTGRRAPSSRSTPASSASWSSWSRTRSSRSGSSSPAWRSRNRSYGRGPRVKPGKPTLVASRPRRRKIPPRAGAAAPSARHVMRRTWMAKEEGIEMEGVVTEVLPDRNYRVMLENGHEILAYAAGKMSKFKIRVLEGDRVSVVLSPYDLTRGRVIYRHK